MRCLLIISFFFPLMLMSQVEQRSALSSAGGYTSLHVGQPNFFVSYTVGQQGIIDQKKIEGFSVFQGFEQPLYVDKVIETPDNTLGVLVYPNPFENTLTIKFKKNIESKIQLSLLDVTGKQLQSFQSNGSTEMYLDLKHFPSGQYILVIFSGNQSQSVKLIKK